MGVAAAALLAVTVVSVLHSLSDARSAQALAQANDQLRDQQGKTEAALAESRDSARNLAAAQEETQKELGRSQDLGSNSPMKRSSRIEP